MTDLVEFLRARLGEDEAKAKRVEPNQSPTELRAMVMRNDDQPFLVIDSARVLREVERDRRIIELHQPDRKLPDDWYGNDAKCKECGQLWHLIKGSSEPSIPRGCRTLRLLALPYDDHPDYRQEWRPA
jgi:sugar lactone lactonase YvrE